ncbi:cytochrome c [Cardiobacterium sp. AH-315-I02]|nr:cytochrome c [Cardiobacterium sp. AH-315-I02]
MREKWARRIALLTAQLVLLMAVVFAVLQNPVEDSDDTENGEQAAITERLQPAILNPQSVAAGQQVYQKQSCARCHSISGKGNSRHPLDGVGKRHSAEQMRGWIIGADTLKSVLPTRAFKIKQSYKELPDEDLDALVSYMAQLI